MISSTIFPSTETWRLYPFPLNGILLPPKRKRVVLGAGAFGVLNTRLRTPQSYLLYPNGRGEYSFWRLGAWVLRRIYKVFFILWIFHPFMPIWRGSSWRREGVGVHPTPFKWFVTVCVSRGKSLVGDTCPKNQTTPKTLGLNAHIVGEPLFLLPILLSFLFP